MGLALFIITLLVNIACPLDRVAPVRVLGSQLMTDRTAMAHPRLGELTFRRRFVNSGMTVLVYIAFALALIPLVWLSYTVVTRGVDRFMVNSHGDHVFNLEFLQQSMRGIFGGGTEGGILHAIWGTVIITGIAALISIPVGPADRRSTWSSMARAASSLP